jgi:putative polyketide hydroxylase
MQTSVLVVGGGVVGLSSALFLARHGVDCVLVERHPDLLIHPRARGLTPRTMEIFRQVDLERQILESAYAGAGFAWTPVQATTLRDEHRTPDEPQEDDGADASPCAFGPIDQDRLEVLVRARARELGADLRFDTELSGLVQTDRGVTADLTDRPTGDRSTVEARYVVAADGADSSIRRSLGIAVDGPGRLFTTMTAMVAADLRPALRGRTATIAYLDKPRPFTILMAHDDAGLRWVFGTGYDERYESLDDFTERRVAEMVREASGLPEVAVTVRPQIPGTDLKVLGFPIGAHVARAYRSGRVFLAGDAAHVWPPTGGLGANAGIQDAHNLAWKLAAVLRGEAGERLLDSYDRERRPVGALTMEQAMARFGARMGPDGGPELIDYGAVAMGYRYPTTETNDTSPVPPKDLRGEPGTRAPHVPLPADATIATTLDLFGAGWVLLVGPAGAPWRAAAGRQRVPVAVYRLERCPGYVRHRRGRRVAGPPGRLRRMAQPRRPAGRRARADGCGRAGPGLTHRGDHCAVGAGGS